MASVPLPQPTQRRTPRYSAKAFSKRATAGPRTNAQFSRTSPPSEKKGPAAKTVYRQRQSFDTTSKRVRNEVEGAGGGGKKRQFTDSHLRRLQDRLAESGDSRLRTYKAELTDDGNILLSRHIIPPGKLSPMPDASAARWMPFFRVGPIKKRDYGLEYVRHDGRWHLILVAGSFREIADFLLENEYAIF